MTAMHEQEGYEKAASAHSGNAITVWLLVGGIYNFATGNIWSWATVLLVLPGVFLASFASIPTYWLKHKKHQIVPKTNSIGVLILFTLTTLLSVLWIPALAIGAMLILRALNL
ncbi:hypothetical protein JNJ66_06120 [Candidatus Saccharibacteria bacterium]|nr:hypothetical protein [Candidatus Saccharibacteria bacterium]